MLNLILDLDNTLIHSVFPKNNDYFLVNIIGAEITNIRYTTTVNKIKKVNENKNTKTKKNTKIRKPPKKEISTTEFLCFKRRQLNLFLRYCFTNFNVGFWTSGETIYAENILKKILLPEEYKKCICIVSRIKIEDKACVFKDSVSNKHFKIDNVNKDIVKKLSYIYNHKINEENTLLLDDNTTNKALNCKNTILIPSYEYNINNDNCFLTLIEQFEKVKKKETFKTFNINEVENELFRDYKLNDKYYTDTVKNYHKNDIVQINDDNIQAYNHDIMILESNKNNYKIMYVDNKTKKIMTTIIDKNKVVLKFFFN